MSNVIPIGLPRRPNLAQRQAMLVESFARHRRGTDDVFWLKENAELLSILAAAQATLPTQCLDVYRPFYEGLEERLRFFPQYYRFLLSICLDLEDLGLKGDKGSALCEHVARSGLVEAELSDLQRAEAAHLLSRRSDHAMDASLSGRLAAFCRRSRTFAVPNKKAAYELTHIVFYDTQYGRKQRQVDRQTVTSLEYAGLLAFLDQDIDLLSEVCVALRLIGITPSSTWEDWLAMEMQGFAIVAAADGPVSDAYHEYIVTSWWAHVAGMSGFAGKPCQHGMKIVRCAASKGALRAMSEVMYQLGPARSSDWHQMRHILQRSLDPEQHVILEGAAQSSDRFDAFFERFARAH
ncbi:MAG: hypothetical protein AAF665_13260 [Pseudomonadota bacterium]